jgi:spermidine synthase
MTFRRALLLVIFFLSGASTLIYQVAWVRQATLVFGVSVYAYSAVLTAFMGGSALGSYWLSRWADRSASPLHMYALLQVGVALLGVLTPRGLLTLLPLYAQLAQALTGNLFLLTTLRLLLALFVLILPTLLMGVTLPVMARAYAASQGRVGREVGHLYAIETLGAALGCALAGLFLLRLVGAQATVWVAATLNLLAAVVAWWLAWGDKETRRQGEGKTRGQGGKETGRQPPSRHSQFTIPHSQLTIHHPPFTIIWLYAFSGFAALGYEVAWARILAIFTLNAIFSFSIMLTTFLVGLTLGGWLMTRWLRRHPAQMVTFGNLQLLLAFLALGTLYLFWWMPERLTLEHFFRTAAAPNIILFEFLLGFLILLAPTTILGMLFPLVVSLYTQEQTSAVSRSVGQINAFNTTGAVLGSLVSGFLLIPWLGLQKTIIALSALNLALGLVTHWLHLAALSRRWQPIGAVALFLLLILLLPPGYYLGFRRDAPETLKFYAEGAETTVAIFVLPDPNTPGKETKISFVNGRIEVPTDPISMRAFRLLGHLPALLRPDAERALMLSFGNGVSTGSLDTHGVPHIDAVDLSAEQFQAAELYWQENYNVLRSAHLHTHVEDGRNFLLQTVTPYDIITTDATHPVNTSSWALFTQEFYQSVASRLTPNGIFMQWLPFHNLSEDDFKQILRTFQTIFPEASLWYTGGSHTLLLATSTPLTRERLLAAFVTGAQSQMVVDDLGLPERWPGYLALGPAALRTYVGDGPISRDDAAFFLPNDEDTVRIRQTLEEAASH